MPLFNPAAASWGYRSTYWYSQPPGATATTLLMGGNISYYSPFIVGSPRLFSAIGTDVTTNSSTGGVLRFGIYSDVNGAPGNLILDAGTASSTAITQATITITQPLSPSLVWLTMNSQGGSATQATVIASAFDPFPLGVNAIASHIASGYQQGGVAGALPASATPGTPVATSPLVYLQAQ